MAQQRSVSLLSVTAAPAATDAVSTPVDMSSIKGPLTALLRATKQSGTGALDVAIEDSLDGQAPWFTWLSFTQLTDDGNEAKAEAARAPLPHRRTKRTIGGDATYDINVDLVGYYS